MGKLLHNMPFVKRCCRCTSQCQGGIDSNPSSLILLLQHYNYCWHALWSDNFCQKFEKNLTWSFPLKALIVASSSSIPSGRLFSQDFIKAHSWEIWEIEETLTIYYNLFAKKQAFSNLIKHRNPFKYFGLWEAWNLREKKTILLQTESSFFEKVQSFKNG